MTQVDGGGLPAGTQLNGIFEIEKRIATGGMGEVYIGHVIRTGDKVAIKTILPEHASNQVIVDLFRREASTMHSLHHEAIVRSYFASDDPVLNRPYLAMEFVTGPSLGERLREGPLGEGELTVLRRRVAEGLHAAHRLGIIHRDISPDNIILVGGEVERAKIIDFGIAKSAAGEGTLIGSGFAGKLNYVSPEQLGLGGGEVTPRSDIYSLGLVFAQAATGRPLPMGGTQVEVIEKRRVVPALDDVPRFIRPLVEAMVQPNPGDRPADMQEVADWEPPDADRGDRIRPPHPRERRGQKPPAERRSGLPWLWIGIGGGALTAAAVAAFLILDDGQAPTGDGEETAVLVPDPKPGPDATPEPSPEPSPETSTEPVPVQVAAPEGVAGEAYDWTLPPFDLPGGAADLTLRVDGTPPPGLTVDPTGDGAARVSGTPRQAGEYDFDVLASTASGKSAWHEVRLTVREPEPEPEPPANLPPTLADALGGRLDLVQGEEVNVALGAFGDEEGAGALRLDIAGRLPGGVDLRLAQGGIAQLSGAPAEAGEFDLRIAAIDPQSLASPPITVTLDIAPPAAVPVDESPPAVGGAEHQAVRDYVLAYDGGDCFLSRPVELGPQLARIEVFASESRIQPVHDFDAAFKRDMGFEATIGMRPISEEQCALISGLDRIGPQALDNALAIAVDRDVLAAGETLSGTITGGEGVRLFLLDHTGRLNDLTGYSETRDGETTFSVPITASGPQILIAARPRDAAGIPATAGLDELLGAARRGEAALALGFVETRG